MLIRKCAKCGKFLGVKLVSFKMWRDFFKTTHGLCDKCLDTFKKEIQGKKAVEKIMTKFTKVV